MDGLSLDYLFSESFDMDGRDVKLESAEIALDKAMLQYNTLDQIHDLRLREAELQCYAEGGDSDTYLSYMEAVDEEISEKKQSALIRVWEKVKELFKQLIEKFFGKNKGKDLPKEEKYLVSKPFAKFITNIKSIASGVKLAIKNEKTKLSENPKWKAFLLLLAGIGTVTIISLKTKKSKREFAKAEKELDDDRIARNLSNTIKKSMNDRVKENNLKIFSGEANIDNKDLKILTGLQLNEGYTSIYDLYTLCYTHAEEVSAHCQKAYGVKVNEGDAEQLSKMATALKPILQKIQYVRRDIEGVTDNAKADVYKLKNGYFMGDKF